MKNRLLLILLCLLGIQFGLAQQNPSLSNLRNKKLPVLSDTIRLDTLSIVPGTFVISEIDSNSYILDIFNAELIWKKKPATDSVFITYRVFPGKFNTVYQRMRFDSISNNFLASPVTIQDATSLQNSIFDFGNVN